MAYEDYCAACTYMNENPDYGKYFCTRKGEWRYACDSKCTSFCEAYGRSNYSRGNMYDVSRNSSGGGCYLTTAMCNILGYADDNYYLQTLREFRDNVLKKSPKYIPLLSYDVIGPIIASELLKDESRTVIAHTLLTRYISKAVDAINENKVEEATNIYVAMTNMLAEKYNINTKIMVVDPKNINMETLGHGRIRKRVLEG